MPAAAANDFYERHFETFAKNADVKTMVQKTFDKQYNKEDAPDWVDFKAYRAEKLAQLTESLFESTVAGEETTQWGKLLLFAFHGKAWKADEVELGVDVKIPKKIHTLVELMKDADEGEDEECDVEECEGEE